MKTKCVVFWMMMIMKDLVDWILLAFKEHLHSAKRLEVRIYDRGWSYSSPLAKSGSMSIVLSIIIAGIVFAVLFPFVIFELKGEITSSWNNAVVVFFMVMFPVLMIVGVIVHLNGKL